MDTECLKFYNFKNRQYPRQPYIIEVYLWKQSFILSIFPNCSEYVKSRNKDWDWFWSLPSFKFSYRDYRNAEYEGVTERDWYNLLEDEPF